MGGSGYPPPISLYEPTACGADNTGRRSIPAAQRPRITPVLLKLIRCSGRMPQGLVTRSIARPTWKRNACSSTCATRVLLLHVLRLPPYTPVLDLEPRRRCRECDVRGKGGRVDQARALARHLKPHRT